MAPIRIQVTAMGTNVLLTGTPGVGKTTLIRKSLDRLDVRCGGFYTEEIREGRRRVGFGIVSLAGDRGILAHVDIKSRSRVGRYGVNVDDIERIGVRALEGALRDSDLIVIDEIARMELYAPSFKRMVICCLDSPKPVLGTIQERKDPFLADIRRRDDVTVVRVTEANRDALVPRILDALGTITSL